MQYFFPHRNTHKETWTFPDGTTRNQIDHIIIHARHVTDILYVRSYSRADCNTDHFLVRAKMRQRIMAMKQKMGEKTELYNVDSLKDGV
jgi:endonuclease/exonuclease/phosphatase family metal-dependent hydrolase